MKLLVLGFLLFFGFYFMFNSETQCLQKQNILENH